MERVTPSMYVLQVFKSQLCLDAPKFGVLSYNEPSTSLEKNEELINLFMQKCFPETKLGFYVFAG